MPLLFALTLFLSAFLLFLIQPMIGKLVLPYLGGTPQVWNTCMVFFQAALLAGYLYAHEITRRLGLKKQVMIQFLLLLLPLAPLALLRLDVGQVARDWFSPPTDTNPIPWLLGVLALVAGLPFFVVATSAPLLQKWYADTGAMGAKDPYFLYGASNLGSMLALVAYPTFIEPKWGLAEQARYWCIGYAVLLTMVLLCGLCARFLAKPAKSVVDARGGPLRAVDVGPDAAGVSIFRRLRWILLALVPSSLMLGVTTYVTTDIAPVALLWIIPLSLYLLSFILVFTRLPRGFNIAMVALLILAVAALVSPVAVPRFGNVPLRDVLLTDLLPIELGPVLSKVVALEHVLYFSCFVLICLILPRLTHAVMVVLLPVVIILLLVGLKSGGMSVPEQLQEWLGLGPRMFGKVWEKIALNFMAVFVAAMVCHGELARTRPQPKYLTGFYLCMSIGGVLGGLFNTVLAPQMFNTLLEYPLVIAAACLLLPRLGLSPQTAIGRFVDTLVPACVFAFGLATGLILLSRDPEINRLLYKETRHLPVAWTERARDWLENASTGDEDVLHMERGFFGVVRVRTRFRWQGMYHYLQHGNINHGMQRVYFSPEGEAAIYAPLAACAEPLDAAVTAVIRQQVARERRRDEPIAYFQSRGPIGDLFAEARSRNRKIRIAVLGMGTGTLAGYAEPGWEIHYYEIDPAVRRIAYDTRYFTYLPDAEKRGVKVETFLGDGRLQIEKHAAGEPYDLIFMDAFSSDSVPVHLLTKEAIQMYLSKLAPGGIIIVNIANRYLDFKPIFGNLADELNLAAMMGESDDDDAWFIGNGRHADLYACSWILLAREKKDFGLLNDYLGTVHDRATWMEVPRKKELGVWTDDFSNLLSVFDWSRKE